MNRSHAWFVERASKLWAATPGRSICCLVPGGNADASRFPEFLDSWLPKAFLLPAKAADCRPLIVRLVPDHSTSAARLVERVRQKIVSATGHPLDLEMASDPGEILDDIVRALSRSGYFLVLVIERFQSFASLANTATVSLLSQLRSLEHEFCLTTIVISSQDCSTIRRRLPPGLAFVNSAYGDNHDLAIMPALTATEFACSAPHLDKSVVEEVYNVGGGPDAVFQALIDESRMGIPEIQERTWKRVSGLLRTFATDLFGEIGSGEIALFKAALANALDEPGVAYLRSLPLAGFLFALEGGAPQGLKGELSKKLAKSLVPAEEKLMSIAGLRLLICSSNPVIDLDLEAEVRAIRQVVDACSMRDKVAVDTIGAVTPDDFIAHLRRFGPTVVHFAGHGNTGGIVMRGEGSATHVVTGQALAQALQDRGVKLVVLNACYSESQAAAIATRVGAVIGTRNVLNDEAATRFSTAFYRTLLSCGLLEAALRDGKDALILYDLEDVYACHGDVVSATFDS